MRAKRARATRMDSERQFTADPRAAESADAVPARGLPMRAFSKSLPMQLLRTREAVMRRFRPGLRSLKVTEQQWRVLRALAHCGELETSALARATFLLAPSLSRILPGMEARQLISRAQRASDLRRTVISLQRRGLRVLAQHAAFSEKIYAEISEHFGPERITHLFSLLQELEAVATEQHGATAGQSPAMRNRRGR
jgi:homoprotocatechuate degradation regulator HpaR